MRERSEVPYALICLLISMTSFIQLILPYHTGMKDYLQKYSGAIQAVSGDLEKDISWRYEDCKDLVAQLDKMVPQDQLQVCYEGCRPVGSITQEKSGMTFPDQLSE